MQNDEVAEIVRLEGQAAQTEKASSADRWRAAMLINGQLERMTYRQLSAAIKEHGGKGSIGHLERMSKCWELVGQVQYEAFKDDFAAYPNFSTIYQSDEVRGEGGQGKSGERGHGGGREPEDNSASGLARSIASCTDTLIQNPAFWPLLTDDDIGLLRETKDKLRVLIRDIGR
jgi:hypothetical protein